MKKLVSLLLALVILAMGSIALAAETYDLALVTDIGTIDDKSFNQGSWEGLVQYAEENNISHKYYQPKEKSDQAYLDTIQLAVEGGAKVIVTPGFLFESPVFQAQDMYPDVTFVLIDGVPHSADYSEFRTEKNVLGVVFAEEQSGFLAGYAAVKDGYTKLGFMGGLAVPAVIRYGYGFVQGADYAAKEMGAKDITINYHYTGDFVATPEVQAKAAAWYNDGVQVIFACGGAIFNSISAAAEKATGASVIGVDVDQSNLSATVITSAMKGLKASVYQAITAFYKNEFPGGQTWVLGADRDGVGLPMETSKFKTFTKADYDAIFAKLVAGEIKLTKDLAEDGKTAVKVSEIPVEIVKITEVE